MLTDKSWLQLECLNPWRLLPFQVLNLTQGFRPSTPGPGTLSRLWRWDIAKTRYSGTRVEVQNKRGFATTRPGWLALILISNLLSKLIMKTDLSDPWVICRRLRTLK